MIGAYVDETGNTGTNLADPTQQYHYVGALLVREDCWHNLSADLKSIAINVLKTKARGSNFEFHGNALFGGKPPWDGIRDERKRLDIYEECLSLLEKHKLHLAYGRCDKKKLTRYSKPMHPHEISFWLCLERIAEHLNEANSLGFIVADEGSKAIKTIARKGLADHRKFGPPFGRAVDISRIVDTVHFMHSVDSAHLQLCDLALWIIRRVRDTPASDRLITLHRMVNKRVSGATTFPY